MTINEYCQFENDGCLCPEDLSDCFDSLMSAWKFSSGSAFLVCISYAFHVAISLKFSHVFAHEKLKVYRGLCSLRSPKNQLCLIISQNSRYTPHWLAPLGKNSLVRKFWRIVGFAFLHTFTVWEHFPSYETIDYLKGTYWFNRRLRSFHNATTNITSRSMSCSASDNQCFAVRVQLALRAACYNQSHL